MAGAAKDVVSQIGGQAELNKMNVLQRRALAESIGGVESLIGHPASMTHASIPKEEREKTKKNKAKNEGPGRGKRRKEDTEGQKCQRKGVR
mgnify:CR=1 FL=1